MSCLLYFFLRNNTSAEVSTLIYDVVFLIMKKIKAIEDFR